MPFNTVARLIGAAALMLGIVSGAIAQAKMVRRTVEEHKGVPTHFWVKGDAPSPNKLITFTVAVKQNEDGKRVLEEELLRRSDPENLEWYGKWLKREEVDALVAPERAAVETVKSWLSNFAMGPVVELGSKGDFVTVTMSVAKAEDMLGSKFFKYSHRFQENVNILRLEENYQVPEEVADVIDFVGPTVRFPALQGARTHGKGSGRELFGPIGNSVTPSFLRKLYNASDAVAAPGTKNIQACASFLNQYYKPSDLKTFFEKYASSAKVTTPTVYGPNDASSPGIEASLDIQYIMGVGRDTPTEFWSTHGQQPHNPENEPFLVFLANLANTTDANMPHTMSVSYGDNEPGVDNGYANRCNVEFQKAGARGISIMFSSGDGGVSGGQSQPCTTFVPTFPAGSPWVTAVGGTKNSNPEVCASFSSGGFSNYFSPPPFQVGAISSYLQNPGIPSSSLFNKSGAGIPDVAAQGENFDVVQNGFTSPVDGTSCSSPTFTAIVGLLNDARMAAGKSSLGYLNQLIYKTAGPGGAFQDITRGSNPGCETDGFPATKGWDPVTGWGTPNFGKLKDIVMALP